MKPALSLFVVQFGVKADTEHRTMNDEQNQIPIPPRGVALFCWVRSTVWKRHARDLVQTPLKLGVLLLAWGALVGGLYVLGYEGIRFIYETAGVGAFLLSRLWFLFLCVVMVMLAVSQLASVYSTCVRSPETRCWMSLPVSARTICRAKWLESSAYSAWAVVALVLPMWCAYLVVLHQSWWRIGWLVLVLLIPFIGVVTACATLGLLVWLRWVGRMALRREWLAVGFVIACSALFWLLGERERTQEQDVWFLALQELLPRMQFAMSSWLPSSWVATGLDAGLNGRWGEWFRSSTLLWSSAFLAWRLLDHSAAAWLLPVLRRYAQPVGDSPGPQATTTSPITWWIRRPFLAFLMKDALLVIRDPVQWSQALVFFGLLGAYFANLHRLAALSVESSWRMGVASLNLACTLLVLGSLGVRFLFPQMSLEGRTLWMLRMSPAGMRQVLLSKVCLYGFLSILLVEGLLVLSTSRLGVPLAIRWWLAGIGFLAALTIVGMTLGLGACFIDLTAQDAARVVSSSNGALVLVLMLGYVGAVVMALTMVWASGSGKPLLWMLLATAEVMGVSVLAGVIPVYRGAAKLTRLEYTV